MARVGCAYCFHTLDCRDPRPGYETVFRCSRGSCDRHYHDACRPKTCLAPNCTGTPTMVVKLPPPGPLPRVSMTAYPVFGGPTNHLDDTPVGLSSGVAGDDQPGQLLIRNNSSENVRVPVPFGPAWATIGLAPPVKDLTMPRLAELDTLAPGETRVLHIQLQPVRPPSELRTITLAGNDLLIRSCPTSSTWYLLAVLSFLALTGLHWIAVLHQVSADVASGAYPGITFGLLCGFSVVVAPAWARAIVLRGLRGVFGKLEERVDSQWVAELYSWVSGTGIDKTLPAYFAHAILSSLVFAATWIAYRVFVWWWAIRAMVSLSDTWVGAAFAAIAYLVVLTLSWWFWLKHFDIHIGRVWLGILYLPRDVWRLVRRGPDAGTPITP